MRSLFAAGIFGLLLINLTAAAAPPATRPAGDADLEPWWNALADPEPAGTRAVLHFVAVPERAVPFIRERLRPVKLSPGELELLLADLASDDDAVWKPAFEKLETDDPRLAVGLVDLMKLVTDDVPRARLVDIVCNVPASTYEKFCPISLESSGGDDAYNFRGKSCSWWAEVRVARINAMPWSRPKPTWLRAVRAIELLRHIATPEAMAVVADMATGHPDALPTRAAKDPTLVIAPP